LPDLLVEVGCEELPSSACHEIVEQAPGLTEAALQAHNLGFERVQVWVAPRRFALSVTGLPERQSGEGRSVAGPPAKAAFDADGKPTRAAEGFARKQGVAVEDLVVREGRDGRPVVFAEVPGDSQPVEALVPDIARRLVEGIRFSKTMRWGDGTGLRFSRPVRWIVAKLDGRTIPFELHGLRAGDVSRGHRFIGGPVTVASAASYKEDVRSVGVVADHEERRQAIVAALDGAAADRDCAWRDPLGKLEEVVFLVEWPSLIVGAIQPDHMRLPPKVLVTAMQSHQRYFPLEEPDGTLHPAFLAISNGDPAHAEAITRGNEGVLAARLQDATFSFEKDLATGLDALDAKLATIVFHQRLGTLADKRDRLVAGVGALAARVGLDDADAVAAARLAKADQGSILVAEFSELQGYAAAHYARLAGHPEPVCRAIEEQYLPEGADSPTPASDAGALLACAEKIDNLVGAFAIDEAPTGSKDPYGLRRAAAGLVRIALERGWDIRLRESFLDAYEAFRRQGAQLVVDDVGAFERSLAAFVDDRLEFHLAQEGVGAEAVKGAVGADIGGLAATADWARSLQRARERDAFWAAWEACNRCVRIAAKGPESNGAWTSAGDAGEDALAEALAASRPRIDAAREARDFDAALDAGAALAPAVDTFFTDVLVNAEDPADRARRYALVRETADVLGRIADFTAITQGGTR
jgi:glycyl-tRNA synthetase beta chain